ncbi:MAG: hypothetical protein RIE59_08635 [Imperialibacter sp.]
MPAKRAFLSLFDMKLLLIVIGFYSLFFNNGDEKRMVAWVIEPSSTLIINGASNVNQFTCGMSSYQYADTLELSERTASYIKFSPNKLSLPVVDFDCAHKMITSDFQETLQSDIYPEIGVSFLSLKAISSTMPGVTSYDAVMLIELSGRKREVSIHFDFWEKSYSLYNLVGSKTLRFTDFEMVPPSKMMGLVKVADELTIDFNLVIRPL